MSTFEILTLIAQATGFSILIYQISQLNRQAHSDGLNYLYSQSSAIREKLMESPHLIRYFRANEECETSTIEPEHKQEAMLLAELYLNYFEHLAIQEMNLRKNDWETWLSILDDVFRESYIMREVYLARKNWYAPALHDLIEERKLQAPPATDNATKRRAI